MITERELIQHLLSLHRSASLSYMSWYSDKEIYLGFYKWRGGNDYDILEQFYFPYKQNGRLIRYLRAAFKKLETPRHRFQCSSGVEAIIS